MKNKRIKIISIIAVAAAAIAGGTFLYRHFLISQISKSVTLEAGQPIAIDLFYTGDPSKIGFVTDVASIDTRVPAEHNIELRMGLFTTTSTLTIVDTTAPEVQVRPQTVFANELPDPSSCLSSVTDMSATTVRYTEDNPDISTAGDYSINVTITDAYGNETIIPVPFTVFEDNFGPVITGTQDLVFYSDEAITYRHGISVIDNYDTNPTLTIDNSEVNADVPGVYPVRYIAEDIHGNRTEVEINLTIIERESDYNPDEYVMQLAQEILDEITTPEMSEAEKAFNIFNWSRYNIRYVTMETNDDWRECAIDGFNSRKGDCYTFYSCCKVMLDCLGIENMYVDRYPYVTNHHVWNLVKINDQWYHCDSTYSSHYSGFLFMYIDSELPEDDRFDEERNGLPPRATESVQEYLNYDSCTIEEN